MELPPAGRLVGPPPPFQVHARSVPYSGLSRAMAAAAAHRAATDEVHTEAPEAYTARLRARF